MRTDPDPSCDATTLAARLVRWFGAHRRDLPWRRARTPYTTWLSEIMLQQTRVCVVEGYFERFLARFPDVHALAGASEDEVLSMWSGLGYYSRGRNLHAAARTVALAGGFPTTAAGLRALPGVGPYTAAAVASLAFGEATAVVDGNVARVLSRLHDIEVPVDAAAGRALIAGFAQALVDTAAAAGPVNEGLMELGALLCTPKSPRCDACPWSDVCKAKARGTIGARPVKAPKRARTRLAVALALVFDDDHVWLEKRLERGLFGGLYAPPARELASRAGPAATVRALLAERGVAAPTRMPAPIVVLRTLTHRDLSLHVVPIRASRRAHPAAPWFSTAQVSEVGTSTAVRAALAKAWPALSQVENFVVGAGDD